MKWLIDRPKVTLLFFVMLTIIGVISFSQMPQREIPEFSPPIGQITTAYPGASAEEVEQQVTNQMEDELSDFEEIESMESVSSPGFSLITIELDENVNDTSTLWNEMRQEVNRLASALPDDSMDPAFETDIGEQGLAVYHVTYDDEASLDDIQSVLEGYDDQLGDVPDITEMDVQGGLEKEVLVSLDPDEMEEQNLSYEQVLGVLNGESETVPIGEWESVDTVYPVNLDNYETMAEYQALPVGVDDEGDVIRLSDVGTMEETFLDREEKVRYDDEPSLSLTFTLRNGGSVNEAQDQLDTFVDQLSADLPEGASIDLLYTQAELVSELFTDLATSFAIAVVAILVVCSLGLRPSSAGSVAIAVPLSLSIGSIALPFLGVELSQISLIGFIIVLAILVDDGIVVNENIERKLREGSLPKEAARTGTREVLVSVITSTIIVVFTFFPILFLPGGAGEFILPLPVVLISTIIASTFVSLLIIPIFRKWKEERSSVSSERRPAGLIGPLLEKMSNVYSEKLMKGVINHPLVVGLGGLLLGTAAFALIPWIPLELFPDSDREEVFIEASLEDGTPLEETEAYAQAIADWVNEEPFVQSVSSYTGTNTPELLDSGGSSEESENLANFLIYIDEDMIDARTAMNQWNEELPEAFGELQTYEVSIIESGPPVGAPIAVEIEGESISELMEKSDEAQQILADTEGVENVNDDVGSPVDAFRLEPDRNVMEDHQLDSSEVSEALAVLEEGVPLGEFETDGELMDWRMMYQGDPLELLDEVTMDSTDDEDIVLSDVVTVNEERIQPRIPRVDGERRITVTAFPGERSEDDIVNDAEDQLMELEEDGYNVTIGGETTERTEVFIQIGQIFIAVVFLIFIAMALQFYSLTIPLILFSAVYLAFSGAIFGLFVTQTGLGFMSLMGGVSLAGIVVRNGIILIEFIEQRRKAGMEVKAAVSLASKQRFRPIILTALTTIAGLSPIAFGNSTLFQPLGITIVFGALFSTMLTLFVVPALYLIRARWKRLIR